jgi:membrane protein YqaA with SNARE-associated domain
LTPLAAYSALAGSAFLAATVFPAQSELVMGALLAEREHSTALLLLVGTAANTLGSVVNWALGRWFAHFSGRRWFPVSERAYARAAGWYNRFGVWSLLFAWVPVIGDPLTAVAGALRVPFVRFVVLVTLGKAARYVFIALAFAGWTAW